MRPDIKKTRVLLVDSSSSFLSAIEKLLDKKEVIIVDRLNNGPEAIAQTGKTSPDIIVISLEMPFMSGLETIEHIMAAHPTPILATTAGTAPDMEDALKKGALEVIGKSLIEKTSLAEFTKKIKFLASVTVSAHPGVTPKRKSQTANSADLKKLYCSEKIISIASSTGGPRAIAEILGSLPEETPFPIVIAQHMPEGFTDGMVRWMNTISKIPVKVGKAGEAVERGFVYFSPSEKHMIIDNNKCVVLENQSESDIFHPSCDKLLNSVAMVYGANTIAVILTGMGDDGVKGMKKVKDFGGVTIAQDEGSSSLFGMPKEAIASGCIDRTIPIKEIAGELKKHFIKEQ